MMLGGISRFKIKRMNVFRILASIAIEIDIRQQTALKTIICIIRYGRQNTEIPSRFNLSSQRVYFLRLRFFFRS